MMVKSSALQNFGSQNDQNQIVEAPAKIDTRRFNECDIIGNLERDEKGNVIPEQDATGKNTDKDGRSTNGRGQLVNKEGDVINNYNSQKMFDKGDIDEKGEVPAPFNIEKHNFNPHEVRGDFNYDRNDKPVIQKKGDGAFSDKK